MLIKKQPRLVLLTALLGIITIPVLTACSWTTFSNSDRFGQEMVVAAQQEQFAFTMPQTQVQAAQLINSWVSGAGGSFDTAAFEKEQQAFDTKNKDSGSSTSGANVFWGGETNFESAKTEVETAVKANLAVKGFVLNLYELSYFYFKYQTSKFGNAATTTFSSGFTIFKPKVMGFINRQNDFLTKTFQQVITGLKGNVTQPKTIVHRRQETTTAEVTLATVPWLNSNKSKVEGADSGEATVCDQNLKVSSSSSSESNGDAKVTTAQAKTIYQKFWQVFKGIHDVMYQDYQASTKLGNGNNSVTFKHQYQSSSNYQKYLNTYYYAAFWYNIYFGEQPPKISDDDLNGTINATNDITSYTNLGIDVGKKV